MESIIIILYLAIGYWVVNKVLYEGKVVFYTSSGKLFIKKLSYAFAFGWILIPIAILKSIFFR